MTKPTPIPLTTKKKIANSLRSLCWVIVLEEEKTIVQEARIPALAEILLLPASLSEKECS